MNNILSLEIENYDAKVLASPYEKINDRKEIYLKYLIISALKKSANIVDIDESLFYSRKFYSLTRLFDFYVNNNVFDLIILKPNGDELLFETIQDDIHSNIYGYTVARISEDFKTAEIVGYFLSKDFNSIVNGNKINVNKLRPVDNFENIEILDSQMSLTDVSEKYFELISMFLDDDIDEAGLSELACLLCNSAELREVFVQIGKFDSLCEETKKYPEFLDDNLLSVFSGEMADEILEAQESENDTEKYNLDDLDSLVENTPVVIDPDEIDISSDLPEILDKTEIENEFFSVEDSSETSILQDVTTEDFSLASVVAENETLENELALLQDESISNDDLSAEQPLLEEFINEEKTENELDSLSQDGEELKVDTADDILFDLDDIVQEETQEPLNNETILDDIALGFSQNNAVDDVLEEVDASQENIQEEEAITLPVLESSEQTLSLSDTDANELLDTGAEENIELMDAISEDNSLLDNEFSLALEDDELVEEQVMEQTNNSNQSRLSAELASLSLKLEEEDDEPIKVEQSQKIEIVEEEKEDFLDDLTIVEEKVLDLEFETESQHEVVKTTEDGTDGANVLSDELMELLGEDTGVSDMTVDDKELYSILGVEQQTENELIVDLSSFGQDIQDEQSITQQETNIHNLTQISQLKPSDVSSTDENVSELNTIEDGQGVAPSSDLRLLYAQAGMANEVEQEGMPIGYQNITTNKNKKGNKKLVAIVALVLLLLAGSGVMINSSKNSNNDYSLASQDNEIESNYPAPKPVEQKQVQKTAPKQVVANSYEEDEDVLSPSANEVSDRKIETSLSNQAGAAPVILKAVAWQVPTSISKDAIFNKYLQIAGKNIKMNLATDLLDTDDFAYNNKIKISMTVKNNTPVKNIKVVESSGSKNVDDIVLQSIKQTLKYINTPVMSEDKGDREVILVISI